MPRRTRIQVGAAAGGDRVVLQLDLQCDAAPGRLQMTDTLSTPFGEHYRTIASVARPDGTRVEQVFDHQHTQAAVRLRPGCAVRYRRLRRPGCGHILSGWDHLLFLAALLIGQRSLRSLLITVTAFTAAHSLSLAAATFGWVRVAPSWVEPVIALSVVWMSLETLLQRAVSWRRHALTFVFGLVHGLAFAEALIELKLAGWPLARALLGFNLGVEAAQVIVVLLIAPALAWVARQPRGHQAERALALAIADDRPGVAGAAPGQRLTSAQPLAQAVRPPSTGNSTPVRRRPVTRRRTHAEWITSDRPPACASR